MTVSVSTALANYQTKLKTYSKSVYITDDLATLTWVNNYYTQITLPADVNEIISVVMLGFSQTNNGMKYQLCVGSDGKSLFVTKVDASYTPVAGEKIGYKIAYV